MSEQEDFFPNSAGMWLFSCHPPVALLAALHLQEGRVPGGASPGRLAAVVCDQEVLAVSLPHESAEVLGWV